MSVDIYIYHNINQITISVKLRGSFLLLSEMWRYHIVNLGLNIVNFFCQKLNITKVLYNIIQLHFK